MTVYVCKNKFCRMKNKEFTAMDIADAKLAIGRGVSCNGCGQVAWFVRKVVGTPQNPDTPSQDVETKPIS